MLRNYLEASSEPTIGDKIRVTSENKQSIPLPSPLHSMLGCLLFSLGNSNSDTTLYEGDWGGKALFYPFKVDETSERPFRSKLSQLILSMIVVPRAFHNS